MTRTEFKVEIRRRVDSTSVTDTAQALGVSRQTVHNWLKGKLPPKHLLKFMTLPFAKAA